MEFQDILKLFKPIRNFISLGIKQPIYPNEVYAYTDKKVAFQNKQISPLISVFYKEGYKHIDKSSLRPDELLFLFDDIKGRFKSILKRWLDISENIKPIHSLYFGALYSPLMYIDDKFINYVQALEIYHRRKIQSNIVNPKEWIKIIEKVIKNIPTGLKSHFRQKMRYAYEPTLRSRLKEILNINPVLKGRLFPNRKKISKFINQVVNTRNYLIHYDEKLEDKTVSGGELFFLTLKLKILIESILLREIGFENKKILNHLLHNIEYQRIFSSP